MLDFSQIPLFALVDRRLAWVDRRQQLLAQNIANADTPGWRTRDLKPFAAMLAAPTVTLAQTAPGHLAGSPDATAAQAQAAQPTELAPDGNGVVLDKEMKKVADTDMAHELTLQVEQVYLGMFRTAIGR